MLRGRCPRGDILYFFLCVYHHRELWTRNLSRLSRAEPVRVIVVDRRKRISVVLPRYPPFLVKMFTVVHSSLLRSL